MGRFGHPLPPLFLLFSPLPWGGIVLVWRECLPSLSSPLPFAGRGGSRYSQTRNFCFLLVAPTRTALFFFLLSDLSSCKTGAPFFWPPYEPIPPRFRPTPFFPSLCRELKLCGHDGVSDPSRLDRVARVMVLPLPLPQIKLWPPSLSY